MMLRRPIWSGTAAVIAGIAAAVALVIAVSLAYPLPVNEPAPGPGRSGGFGGAVTASKPDSGSGAFTGSGLASGHQKSVRADPSTGSGEARTDDLSAIPPAWRAGGEPAPVAPRILARVAPRPPQAPPEKEATDAAEAAPPAGGEARIESIEIDWDWSAGDGR